jgi:hypothetical protein
MEEKSRVDSIQISKVGNRVGRIIAPTKIHTKKHQIELRKGIVSEVANILDLIWLAW